MSDLTEQHCAPCEGGMPPLDDAEVQERLLDVVDWRVEDGKLVRDIQSRTFKQVLALVNRIGELAESEGHHPDLWIHDWNRLQIHLWTHSIGGLSLNDFILSAKINQLKGVHDE